MSLLKKKCGYCRKKVEKGEEVLKDVKVPGFIGTSERVFCCSEHANKYEKEMKEQEKNHKHSGHCCG